MTAIYHHDLIQGEEPWRAARRGLLTASEMDLIITPAKLQVADNEKTRLHLYDLLAQRITGHVEPGYESFDMARGKEEEIWARIAYAENYAPVEECGFITNEFPLDDQLTFRLGYSPDGLVGDDGLIEAKSRMPKHQLRVLLEHVAEDTIPPEFMLQVQTGLLVSERAWCDFISYSGGLHMATVRVYPDEEVQNAILAAAAVFETRLNEKMERYLALLESSARLIETERRVFSEITV
jgi:YqaJ-like viral recombinase domain